jgi:hypothetical protein
VRNLSDDAEIERTQAGLHDRETGRENVDAP